MNLNCWPTARDFPVRETRRCLQPILRASLYRRRAGQTTHGGIHAGLRQRDGSLINPRGRCRRHPSSPCLLAAGGKNSPEGHQWEGDQRAAAASSSSVCSLFRVILTEAVRPRPPPSSVSQDPPQVFWGPGGPQGADFEFGVTELMEAHLPHLSLSLSK